MLLLLSLLLLLLLLIFTFRINGAFEIDKELARFKYFSIIIYHLQFEIIFSKRL